MGAGTFLGRLLFPIPRISMPEPGIPRQLPLLIQAFCGPGGPKLLNRLPLASSSHGDDAKMALRIAQIQEESRKVTYSYDRKRYIGDMANWVGDCHMTPSIACLYLLLGVGSARCCVSLKEKKARKRKSGACKRPKPSVANYTKPTGMCGAHSTWSVRL